MSSAEIAVRQAEFLNALSSLLNKYQAEILLAHDGDGLVIAIDASGSPIRFAFAGSINVDNCIEATQSTITYAMGLTNSQHPEPLEAGKA